MNVYLVRHGETAFNKLGIVQGSGIDSDLNDVGRTQALQLYEMYKAIPFDLILLSNLKRTYQTAQNFIELDHRKFIKLQALNEISWGENEGKEFTPEREKRFSGVTESWANGNLEAKIKGGESAIELFARCQVVVDFLKENYKKLDNVLIVTHGRTLTALHILFTNNLQTEINTFKHPNTSLYKYEFDGEEFINTIHKDLTHLIELSGIRSQVSGNW